MTEQEFMTWGYFFIVIALIVGFVVGYNLGENQSCPVAEVYMSPSIQEDDLFIPASSIGKVDLKR